MRLLSLTLEEIRALAEKMEKEAKAIKSELFRIAWFMRGGLSISEAYQTDWLDREVISKIIEDNLETTNKTRLPFF